MKRATLALALVGALAVPPAAIFLALQGLDTTPRGSQDPRGVASLSSLRSASGLLKELASPADERLTKAAKAQLEDPKRPERQVEYALALEEKAREVANAGYHRLAEEAARRALALDPNHAPARAALAIALVGQHKFEEGLAYVSGLKDVRSLWRLSCETDCLYELGRYDEAVAAAQELVDLRPGLESYPRVALLRELHGLLEGPEGAGALWELAAGDAPPKSSGRAWAISKLAELAVRRGDVPAGEAGYRAALEEQPWYAVAHVGLARALVAQGKLELARNILEPLLPTNGDLGLASLLGDIEAALGQQDLATSTWQKGLDAEAWSAAHGLQDRKALALFLADHEREPERAVEAARAEVAARPTVWAEDVLAWALLAAGKAEEAREHSQRARRLGTRDPWVLYHAGAIEAALGQRPAAADLLRAALASGLEGDPRQREKARRLLAGS